MQIQQAREARNRAVVVFAKFVSDVNLYKNKIFCFFEGEDYKYYRERIETHAHYKFNDIVHYNCGGRTEVLRLHKLIMPKDEYAKVKIAFFIDHDYIPAAELSINVYQTPCYAIENFYTSIDSFKRMLNEEFGISPIEKDFEKCIDDYLARQQEFHDITLILNSWLRYQREKEEQSGQINIDLKSFKLHQLFNSITIDRVDCKCSIDIPKIISLFVCSYPIDQETFDVIFTEFQTSNRQMCFRGKFELLFYQRIILDLKEKNRTGTYFTERRSSIQIDPYINPLSSLSKYADTPECLVHFLSQFVPT